MGPPATATTGIYCKTCGYDLRASGEAKRCPECGRAFSPDDPKSFRPRPFAAPWKRALGRWAKRGAMLLLVLVVLLGSLWGWLYWGWKQEQAVLAQTRGKEDPLGRGTLGGEPGRWLHDRHVPGSFVLERTRNITLTAPATDADLLPLQKLPELEWLWATGPITDAGLVHLARCPRLKFLGLQNTRVTDAGLVHLSKLAALEWLDLSSTDITDAGLVHLAKLAALESLNLSHTGITDAGLVHLEKLRTLRCIYLRGTKVTPAGKARLKAALPGCMFGEPAPT